MTRTARRSSLEESNRTKAGVLEWMGWKRDTAKKGYRVADAPIPVNRESVHSNVGQKWLESKAEGVHLIEFSKDVWTVEGPVVNFFGIPYPTRMVVIKLSDDTSWIWSPIEYSEGLLQEIEQKSGPVRHLISPNMIHWLFLKVWQGHCPDAKTYASPGLKERKVVSKSNIHFDAVLTNSPDPSYAKDIDQIHVRGGFLDEIEFFHKPSKTAIFCDLIQRHREEDLRKRSNAFKTWLMKVDGMVGEKGSTPKEWRFGFWAYGLLPEARKHINMVLDQWQPEKLIIAHGDNATCNGAQVIDQCLPWIPLQPKECICCFPKCK